ncbi:MAG: hypothetical protein JNN00_06625 [Chitinophagaceae bacterium]|nr:hypothetical protein [Chitinophagaceae bacterium]
MDRLTGINKRGDWKMVNEEPDSETSEDDLRHFFQLRNFKYVEANGDTTSVKVTDTSWVDHFRDGTYSRLSLRKVKENEYVISFMESDNILRKNLSKPGDKYRYKILKRYQNYYLMYVEPVGSDVKSEFKLYY